ncbi:DUF6461 domain-containing protein [Kitasatospora sp. GAS204B]|uniref:DUF6461 domain-containing protein n=1 Tax=unclassified Kitasatospora TaxID=2633591 RepID=UPI00247460CF|nr:DUF6461 domain-containing protein [Kitasatospora sp. GAS204B]MDH6117280.1 hypothetical protein [Kitasatospora sp. GAS204B]
MPTPGFPADTLDEDGTPVWITDLASEHPNHTVHVVRDLSPQDALLALGAKPALITSCELPAERPDEWTSLARAAIGPTDSGAVLLAGRVGDWTFVYDDGGLTGFTLDGDTPATLLSATGREAATSTFSINADTNLEYAVDGESLFAVYEELDPTADEEEEIPAALRDAVEAAGTFDQEDLDEGEPDGAINLRVLCALAGLRCTLDDLRRIPLWAAPFS